jgi:hypothetical protein
MSLFDLNFFDQSLFSHYGKFIENFLFNINLRYLCDNEQVQNFYCYRC